MTIFNVSYSTELELPLASIPANHCRKALPESRTDSAQHGS